MGVVIRRLAVSVVLLVAGVGVLHLLPHQAPSPASVNQTSLKHDDPEPVSRDHR